METDYISREAALAAMTALRQEDIEAFGMVIPECFPSASAIDALNKIPAADVVEVVRCGGCIYGDSDPSTSSEIFCEKHCRWLSKDHYCADGERRTENAE